MVCNFNKKRDFLQNHAMMHISKRVWGNSVISRIFSTSSPVVAICNSMAGKDSFYVKSLQRLTWYSCGPTVYDDAHLGHARTYVCTDIIRRILFNVFSVDVIFAMGITDVDDKIIKKCEDLKITKWKDMEKVARNLERSFFEDMDELNVLRPSVVLRVTEHIEEIIEFIQQLTRSGNAYITSDGVYFRASSLKGAYDKFQLAGGNADNADQLNEGPIGGHDKESSRDFALWKLVKPSTANAEEELFWTSPWGNGRPGWHIECSAMTHSYFGKTLDIHSGGVDLKFPHHTNEIAQCESHHCTDPSHDWVRCWLHTGHLYIEGRKMSKSLKNFVSIRDYLQQGLTSHPADDFRLFCLQFKYASSLHFAADRIQQAAAYREKVTNALSYIDLALKQRKRNLDVGDKLGSAVRMRTRRATKESIALQELLLSTRAAVLKALGNDFDTPKMLLLIQELLSATLEYSRGIATEQLPSATILEPQIMLCQPTEPLLEVDAYVRGLMGAVGLRFCSRDETSGSAAGGGSQNRNRELLDRLVSYRAAVRRSALQQGKLLKRMTKAMKSSDGSQLDVEAWKEQLGELASMNSDVLQHCDAVRKELGEDVGVQIDDVGDSSVWRKL